MIEPPGGDCVESCFAAAWMVLKAPVRLVFIVLLQSSSEMLSSSLSVRGLPRYLV